MLGDQPTFYYVKFNLTFLLVVVHYQRCLVRNAATWF